MKILIVDDDAICLKVMARGLGKAGYETVSVASAEEAIELLEGGEPPIDLVITDLSMKGMDGFDLLAYLRKQPRYQKMPALVCTGTATRETVTRVAKYRISGLLLKPLDVHKLRSHVKRIFQSDRSALADVEATLSRLDLDLDVYRESLADLVRELTRGVVDVQNLLSQTNQRGLSERLATMREASQNLGADRVADLLAERANAPNAGENAVRALLIDLQKEIGILGEAAREL